MERVLTEGLRPDTGRFGGGPPPPNLPSGTYGELRDRDGKLIGKPQRASLFVEDTERLALPADLADRPAAHGREAATTRTACRPSARGRCRARPSSWRCR